MTTDKPSVQQHKSELLLLFLNINHIRSTPCEREQHHVFFSLKPYSSSALPKAATICCFEPLEDGMSIRPNKLANRTAMPFLDFSVVNVVVAGVLLINIDHLFFPPCELEQDHVFFSFKINGDATNPIASAICSVEPIVNGFLIRQRTAQSTTVPAFEDPKVD